VQCDERAVHGIQNGNPIGKIDFDLRREFVTAQLADLCVELGVFRGALKSADVGEAETA
jgi:hypothetical protein